MISKPVKVPNELIGAPYYHRDLVLNGVTVVESCTHTKRRRGAMFLEDHMLLVVMEGRNTITYGSKEYIVNKNEMVILKKAIQIGYDKTGNADKDDTYDSLMFFIKDEFLIDFMKMAAIGSVETVEPAKVTVKPVRERLRTFFDSVVPYFQEPEHIDGALVRLKMLELLFDLANADRNLLQQLLQLKQQVYGDIPTIIMENYASPASLSDLAYLCGRSLSTFKRDFVKIYQTSPAQWIREKRLSKAKEMLMADMSVTEVCFSLGFENVAHFSRLYKSFHGISPSGHKQSLISV